MITSARDRPRAPVSVEAILQAGCAGHELQLFMSANSPGAVSNARYPRNARVRARPEFDAVFARGRRAATPMLAVHFLADDGSARLGLAVSRKVDKRAVVRNRIKRVLRDYFRRQRVELTGGAYVVVARATAARATGPELVAAFQQALRRAALPPSLTGGTMPPASSSSAQAPIPSGATSPSAS